MPSPSPSTCFWPSGFSCTTCTGFWALDPLDAAADRGGKSTIRGTVLAGGLASCPSSSSGLKEGECSVRILVGARSWRQRRIVLFHFQAVSHNASRWRERSLAESVNFRRVLSPRQRHHGARMQPAPWGLQPREHLTITSTQLTRNQVGSAIMGCTNSAAADLTTSAESSPGHTHGSSEELVQTLQAYPSWVLGDVSLPIRELTLAKKGGGEEGGGRERGRIRVRFREKGASKGCASPPARWARRVEAWRRCEGGGGVLPLLRFRRGRLARAGRWRGRRRHGR